MVLDVRNKTEHAAGHIPGSYQLSGGRVMWHLDELPAEGTIVSYCQSGVRNSVAASALRRAGYDVVELDGSYAAWAAQQQKRRPSTPANTARQGRRPGKPGPPPFLRPRKNPHFPRPGSLPAGVTAGYGPAAPCVRTCVRSAQQHSREPPGPAIRTTRRSAPGTWSSTSAGAAARDSAAETGSRRRWCSRACGKPFGGTAGRGASRGAGSVGRCRPAGRRRLSSQARASGSEVK